jgi:hypothetical protein
MDETVGSITNWLPGDLPLTNKVDEIIISSISFVEMVITESFVFTL